MSPSKRIPFERALDDVCIFWSTRRENVSQYQWIYECWERSLSYLLRYRGKP